MSISRTLARNVVNQATRLVGWARRKQRITPPLNRPIKVNLGCGLQVAPGWLNIDGSLNSLVASTPSWMQSLAYKVSGARQFYSVEYYRQTLSNNLFRHHNLLYGIPLEDKAASFVYSSHFLEHLDRREGHKLVKECFRVLKPDGVLRIAVPDLEYAWEMYRLGEKDKMIHDFFFADDTSGLGQHRYAYDFEMLERLLRESGFDRVVRRKFQEGLTPDLSLLDNREDYTLFVEGCRPIEDLSTDREEPAQ